MLFGDIGLFGLYMNPIVESVLRIFFHISKQLALHFFCDRSNGPSMLYLSVGRADW